MKVLYLAPISDGTGYSHAAHDHIRSLLAAGIDVVSRDIKLSTYTDAVPKVVAATLDGNLDNVTHTVQHILPYAFEWNNKAKHIGCFAYETDSIKPMGWHLMCNYMDAITTFSQHNVDMCVNSGVIKPVRKIPQACDITKYKKPGEFNAGVNSDNRYMFYCIADWSYRKNISELIRAYLDEFTFSDNVILVLKTYCSGKTADQSLQIITTEINQIKDKLRKNQNGNFPPIQLICDRLSEDQMAGLHQQGNCYVSVELGSGWCIPAFDALGFGNRVIAPNNGGHVDFCRECPELFIELPTTLESCYGMDRDTAPYYELYSCHQKWHRPNYMDIKYSLRLAYQNILGKINNSDWLQAYSYESVGKLWDKFLKE